MVTVMSRMRWLADPSLSPWAVWIVQHYETPKNMVLGVFCDRQSAADFANEVGGQFPGGVSLCFLSSVRGGFFWCAWQPLWGREYRAGVDARQLQGAGGLGGFGLGCFVEGHVAEHGEQDVAAAPGEGDEGLVVAFTLGPFAVVIRP
jgi:hypothetical protein